MKKIFWGFLLIFLDFNFTFNGHVLGLIPDFAGYLMLLGGLGEMACESPLFEKVRPFAVGMAIYTGILYLGNLLGVTQSGSGIEILLKILSTVLSLYISWAVIVAIRDVAARRSVDLNGDSLLTVWKVIAVMDVVIAVMDVMAYLGLILSVLGFFILLAGLIANIVFLVALWRGKGLYESIPPAGRPGPESN